ncbi:hypothetical protein [Methanoculleus frigidifontis]|uniref:hypothetical protein n=1 Tax=Methanoculleus frigidifontis TaxID=2584085 RepID=UPI00265A7F6F|nr:hypothetical protein [Methanoculleus sp. FWC-SCC1]
MVDRMLGAGTVIGYNDALVLAVAAAIGRMGSPDGTTPDWGGMAPKSGSIKIFGHTEII